MDLIHTPKAHTVHRGAGTTPMPADLMTVKVNCRHTFGTSGECQITSISALVRYVGRGSDPELEEYGTFEGTDPQEFWGWVNSCLRRGWPLTVYATTPHHEVAGHLRLADYVSREEWNVTRDLIATKGLAVIRRLVRPGDAGYDRKVTKDIAKNRVEIAFRNIDLLALPQGLPYGVSKVACLVEEFGGTEVEAMMKAVVMLQHERIQHDLGADKPTPSGQMMAALVNRFLSDKKSKGEYQVKTEADEFYPTRKRESATQVSAPVRGRSAPILYVSDRQDILNLERECSANSGPIIEVLKPGVPEEEICLLDRSKAYLSVIRDRTLTLPTRCVVYRAHQSLLAEQTPGEGGELERACQTVARWIAKGNCVIARINGVAMDTVDIEDHLRRGKVTSIEDAIFYEGEAFLADFGDFVAERLHHHRGSPFMSRWYKLFGNAPHGKFDQEFENWVPIPEELLPLLGDIELNPGQQVEDVHYYDGEEFHTTTVRNSFGTVEMLEGTHYTYYTMKAISSHIRSYARMQLRRMIETVGTENVYYINTDAVMTNAEGKHRAELSGLIGPKMGQLKIEVDLTDDAEITSIGHYQLNGIWKGNPKALHQGIVERFRTALEAKRESDPYRPYVIARSHNEG